MDHHNSKKTINIVQIQNINLETKGAQDFFFSLSSQKAGNPP
jgi:hypothetical protein